MKEWELHSQWATDLTESACDVQAAYAAAFPSGGAFRYHRLCLVLARSIPPNKRESSSWVSSTLPCASPDCGQVKRPFSNRLAQIQSPLPSQTGTFKRLRWALQNKNRWPLRGSHDNRSRTRPYRPSNPLRMSVTPAARWIRVAGPNPNTAYAR